MSADRLAWVAEAADPAAQSDLSLHAMAVDGLAVISKLLRKSRVTHATELAANTALGWR